MKNENRTAPFHHILYSPSKPKIDAFFSPSMDGHECRIGVAKRRSSKGTVLIFPGRGECMEKYSEIILDLHDRGYGTCIIDWRGQGLSGRLSRHGDFIQHVDSFHDYQRDAANLAAVAERSGMKRPWHVFSHSMGGVIAFRALKEWLNADSIVFSSPMFGIGIGAAGRMMYHFIGRMHSAFGNGDRIIPGFRESPYILNHPFDGNLFTTHKPSYDRMKAAAMHRPELHAGNPSIGWLQKAFMECGMVRMMHSPRIPALFIYGTEDRVVDNAATDARHADWRNAKRVMVNKGRHELFMESRKSRDVIMDRIGLFLESH